MSEWIPDEEWEIIVENVPIVSVDLVVECPKGIVLGKRSNEPAKGKWFVPGGRVQKGESLEEAAHRIANVELGIDIELHDSLGAFSHFYETSEAGCDKHYVAHGYHAWTDVTTFERDTQHEDIRPVDPLPTGLHDYVEQYIAAMEIDLDRQ